MKIKLLLLFIAITVLSCNTDKKKNQVGAEIERLETSKEIEKKIISNFDIHPISHATMVLEWDNKTIYVDPVGGAAVFDEHKAPDLILVTDIHGDHLNLETIEGVRTENTKIIAPATVAENFTDALKSKTTILANGKTAILKSLEGFSIEAIPMYNLREEALKFHSKGRGNGYVITKNGKRVYISGDTEDIPEMRALQNIDIAFVCMNLPYTMTVDSAASAVLEFAPKVVYPYHYRGTEGLSNVAEFNSLIQAGNQKIKVEQLDWYPVK